MPIYQLKCPHCGSSREYLMALCEDEIKCANKKCGQMIERSGNVDYAKTPPVAIKGETCSKS